MEEFTSLLTYRQRSRACSAFILVIMGIGVVIGFAVVCLSMYMAVLQRTREIGILKSLGGSKSFILRMILSEALLLGIGGTILGILMSYGAYWLIKTLVPASLPDGHRLPVVADRRRHHGGRSRCWARSIPG